MDWILTISVLKWDSLTDVSQFSASSVGVNARPGPPPALILAPARAEKEAHSHTETSPPVHTNNCQHNKATDYTQSDRLFVFLSCFSSNLMRCNNNLGILTKGVELVFISDYRKTVLFAAVLGGCERVRKCFRN